MKKEDRDKMAKVVESFGGHGVSDIRLEDYNEDTLFLDRLDLDTHVVIHSPAISYYGYQYQRAVDNVKSVKEDYNRWKTRKLAEAEAQIIATTDKQPTLDQKANRFYANCEEEKRTTKVDPDMKWRGMIEEAEETARLCKFWLDGFTNKNYLLKLFSDMRSGEDKSVSVIKEKQTKPLTRGGMQRI
jgi:hypothetical protein